LTEVQKELNAGMIGSDPSLTANKKSQNKSSPGAIRRSLREREREREGGKL
jgi:hypothetical protein